VRVLGIDPGLRELGYAILEEGVNLLKANTIYTSSSVGRPERLRIIYQILDEEVELYKPELLCVERVFFHRNAKSAMEIGEVRGVVLLLCAQRGMRVLEISPLELKRALTNWGKASKKDIAEVLRRFFGLSLSTSHEYDAAALALCGFTAIKRNLYLDDRVSQR